MAHLKVPAGEFELQDGVDTRHLRDELRTGLGSGRTVPVFVTMGSGQSTTLMLNPSALAWWIILD